MKEEKKTNLFNLVLTKFDKYAICPLIKKLTTIRFLN